MTRLRCMPSRLRRSSVAKRAVGPQRVQRGLPSAIVKRPSYSALPTITPPRFTWRSAAQRLQVVERADAARVEEAAADDSRRCGAPRRGRALEHPVAVDVGVDELSGPRGSAGRSMTASAGIVVVSCQPEVATFPPRVSTQTMTRSRKAPSTSSRKSTSVKAAVPRITRSAPARSASRTRSKRAQAAAVLDRDVAARR